MLCVGLPALAVLAPERLLLVTEAVGVLAGSASGVAVSLQHLCLLKQGEHAAGDSSNLGQRQPQQHCGLLKVGCCCTGAGSWQPAIKHWPMHLEGQGLQQQQSVRPGTQERPTAGAELGSPACSS